jgi:hypothetical protein
LPPQFEKSLTVLSISGISFCMAGASAGGVVASGSLLPSSLTKSFTTLYILSGSLLNLS